MSRSIPVCVSVFLSISVYSVPLFLICFCLCVCLCLSVSFCFCLSVATIAFIATVVLRFFASIVHSGVYGCHIIIADRFWFLSLQDYHGFENYISIAQFIYKCTCILKIVSELLQLVLFLHHKSAHPDLHKVHHVCTCGIEKGVLYNYVRSHCGVGLFFLI